MTHNLLRSVLPETLTFPIGSRLPSWHRQQTPLTSRLVPLLLVAIALVGSAPAQSQSQTTPSPQPQQTQAPPVVTSPNAKVDKDNSATGKVFTNHDLKVLPSGDISVVGPATPPPDAIRPNVTTPARSASANQADQDAKAAAYWKARFAAARNKLAQDQKTLPSLQKQLETERVQQDSDLADDTGQVYSDLFVDLLHRIDATKLAIQNDKQALYDLHDRFRRAGGQPGWIR